MADLPETNIMAELSKINRRLTLIENRFSNLSDQVNLIENSLNEKHEASGKNVSNMDLSLKELKDRVNNFELEIKKFNGMELRNIPYFRVYIPKILGTGFLATDT